MVDPRLNSVHLDKDRREQFRQARDALLGARGVKTQAGLATAEPQSELSPSPTLIQNTSNKVPECAVCWLSDHEFIYPLQPGLNTVGRAPDNDVVIQDAYISRRHCAVLVHSNYNCELHDIASKNGTWINGKPLAGPTPLRPGDSITICDRQMTFHSKQALPREPEPTRTLCD